MNCERHSETYGGFSGLGPDFELAAKEFDQVFRVEQTDSWLFSAKGDLRGRIQGRVNDCISEIQIGACDLKFESWILGLVHDLGYERNSAEVGKLNGCS